MRVSLVLAIAAPPLAHHNVADGHETSQVRLGAVDGRVGNAHFRRAAHKQVRELMLARDVAVAGVVFVVVDRLLLDHVELDKRLRLEQILERIFEECEPKAADSSPEFALDERLTR